MKLNPTEDQLGQALFARACCGDEGVMVDIGCGSPEHFSNSKPLLLNLNWKSYGIDLKVDPRWANYEEMRAFEGDATTFDWHLPDYVNYLSVDVDEHSFKALQNFFNHSPNKPKCATIEHDYYKLFDVLRTPQRELMGNLGYVLVGNNLWNFEDWWVHESHPRVNDIAIFLSQWGDEENDDIQHIARFKSHLRQLYKQLQ